MNEEELWILIFEKLEAHINKGVKLEVKVKMIQIL